jgi:hypothetical protein
LNFLSVILALSCKWIGSSRRNNFQIGNCQLLFLWWPGSDFLWYEYVDSGKQDYLNPQIIGVTLTVRFLWGRRAVLGFELGLVRLWSQGSYTHNYACLKDLVLSEFT